MPKINLSVSHNLSQEEAKRRISTLLADSRTRFAGKVSDVTESWSGYVDSFSFEAMGFSVTGKLDVQPAEVHVEMNIPWAAYPLKGRVEDEIRKHARELLG
jgi:predicted NBD/HSP70 family sugar kinase